MAVKKYRQSGCAANSENKCCFPRFVMKYQIVKNSYFILFMSEEQCIYYKFGYSSDNFLSIKNSLYTNSRLVCLDVIQEIQCDLVMKWMFVKERRHYLSNGRMIPLDRVIKNDIINMNDNGERWEGDSLNNLPYGFGSYYNSENQVIFNGFMFEGMKVCFGIEYYGDIGTVQYVGSYYYNTRCGYGKLYNKLNEIVYEGEWYNDRPITDTLKIMNTLKEEDIHFGLKEIIICDGCISDYTIINLNYLNRLNKLIIGKKSLLTVTSLILKSVIVWYL